MDERMREQLALYALGGLTEAENEEVEAYLADHPAARDELQALLWTTDALVETAVPLPPSPALDEALLARVEADARARFPRAQAPAPAADRASGGLLAALRRWFSGPFVGGVGVALAALLLIWGLSLTRQLDRADAQLQAQAARLDGLALQLDDVADNNTTLQAEVTALAAERDAVAAQLAALRRESGALETQLAALEQQNATLLASNAGLAQDAAQAQDVMTLLTAGSVAQVALPGTAEQPAAQGRLLFQPESQVALLMVEDLPALGSGQVYQVLLIRDDGHDTAETFSVDFNGQNVVLVHAQAPLETFTAVGVSIEPTGGSPQRTGEIVLLGELLES